VSAVPSTGGETGGGVSGRYWVMTFLGLGLAGGALVGFVWGLYHVTRTGSCSSGGTYVSRLPPCPPGTAGHILAIVFGCFVGLAGIGIYAARGSGGRKSRIGLGAIMWCLLFVGASVALLVSAYGPAHNPHDSGAKVVTAIMAAIFIPLGLAVLPFARGSSRKQQLAADLVATGRRCPGEVVSVEDTNVTINDNPRVKITVKAEPPGEEAFYVNKTATVSRVAIPRPGDRCTVFYDPADRQNRNGITFDIVPGLGAAPSGPAVSIEALAPGISRAMTSASAPAPPAGSGSSDDDDEDALAKIEKLGQMRDRGLITSDEFESQKRRLLDEV
jgi:hypothetical protein